MSRKLDQELAEAIAGGGSGEADAPAVAKPVAPRVAPPKKKNVGLLATLLGMVGLLLAVFLGKSFKEASVYAMSVDTLLASKADKVGRPVRVEGELVPGTLVKRDQPCEYRFTIHKDAQELPVRYASCVIPDTFRDMPGGGVSVTVEGALTAQGEFQAKLVMAKCASKYDPKTHQMGQGGPQANGAMPGTR